MKRPDGVERIEADGRCLAWIVRRHCRPETTRFLTPPECLQQVGFVVYPAGQGVPPHVHRPIERRIRGTPETVLVWRGACEVDLYDEQRRPVASRRLEEGDAVILVAGGHGFRMHEDTILFEVKQGPYTGLDEKERF